MAELTDTELKVALESLLGREIGPISGSTRSLYEKKYDALRRQPKKSPSRQSISTRPKQGRSITEQDVASEIREPYSIYPALNSTEIGLNNSHDRTRTRSSGVGEGVQAPYTEGSRINSQQNEDRILRDCELAEKLFVVFGERYPITDLTRESLTQKLHRATQGDFSKISSKCGNDDDIIEVKPGLFSKDTTTKSPKSKSYGARLRDLSAIYTPQNARPEEFDGVDFSDSSYSSQRVKGSHQHKTTLTGVKDDLSAKRTIQNKSNASYAVAVVLVVVSILATYAYRYYKSPALVDLIEPGDNILQYMCSASRPVSSTSCFDKDELQEVLPMIRTARSYLAQISGAVECNQRPLNERVISSVVLYEYLNSIYGGVPQGRWDTILLLIMKNPQWGIQLHFELSDSFKETVEGISALESTVTTKSLSCTFNQGFSKFINLTLALFAVAVLGYLSYGFGKARKLKQQKMEQLQEDIVKRVTDILEKQNLKSKADGREPPYVVVSHIHDALINAYDRRDFPEAWKKAAAYLKENGGRFREEVQPFHGEEHIVWRLLQNTAAVAM